MSIRRESAVVHTNLMPVGAPIPQSISDRLGIKQSATPAQWPAPFKPEFKEVPVVSSNVVEDLFDELEVDETGLFGKKNKTASSAKVKGGKSTKGGILANLKAAKSKADSVVRKASSSAAAGAKKAMAGAKKATEGAKKAAAGAVKRFVGMGRFDYEVHNDEFTAVLAVAKKTNGGTEVEEKNMIKAFHKYKHEAVADEAENQEKNMFRTETQVKKVKGRDDEVSTRAGEGRHAAVLGYSKVLYSEEEDKRFASAIFDKDAPGDEGVPTIVKLTEYDTNKKEGMYPITALVLEAMNRKDIKTSGEDEQGKEVITVTMQAVSGANIEEEVVNRYSVDQINFQYALCVHGLYVNNEKQLMMGRKILVYQQDPTDITKYGIVTDSGIESALHHAMVGTEIDLLYLWACYRLVAGVHNLAKAVGIDKTQKEAIKELLGEGLGQVTLHSFAENFDDGEFDEINSTAIMM